jgi:F1F0 ATPase subunit 2
MNETVTLILAWLAGVVIGAVFFGGLWWTVSRGVSSKRPALLFLGSQLLRTGTALAGFYFVSGGHWERLLLCLLGFVMARMVVTRLTRPSGENQTRPTQENQPCN